MRIISGKFRGLKLQPPVDFSIRPTSDRLKESLFSILESNKYNICLLYTSPSPRDVEESRMPSSA